MRRVWPRALAGAFLAAAIVGLGSPAALAATPTAIGTLSVSPGTVTAGVPQPFTLTLTFTAQAVIPDGTVNIQVPLGWPLPETQTPGTPGYTVCAACGPGLLAVAGRTITVTNVSIAPASAFVRVELSSISVTYSATLPAYAPGGTFTATAQQSPRLVPVSTNSEVVTVTTPGSPLPSVTVSSPVSPPPSPSPSASQTVSPSPSPSRSLSSAPLVSPTITHVPDGSGSGVPIALVLGLAAAFAAILGVGRLLRHRRAPLTAQSVRAVPGEGPPPQVSVRATGADATRTVRIEPHAGVAVTTLEEAEH